MTPKISSLHHRMRQFSDYLVEEEMRVYHEIGIEIPYRWHSILQIFDEYTEVLTITDLADIQNKTHPDVVYTINQMQKDDLIKEETDKSDRRKRIVSPSPKAKILIEELKPSWQAVQDATNQWVKEIAPDLWLNFEALTNSLEKKTFFQRIKKEKKRADLRNVQLIPFSAVQDGATLLQTFWSGFKSKYFNIAELDRYMQDMRSIITRNQGDCFFAKWHDQIIGCLCIIRRSFNYCEIIHLWVDDTHRRRYVGTRMLEKAISTSKEMGASTIFLQSHPKLVAANALFQQSGFTTMGQMPKSFEEYPILTMALVKELH